MIKRETAIKAIKNICKEHKIIGLCVKGGTASWGSRGAVLTPIEWKHIGYVSALAFAFDIDEVK